MKLLEIKEQSRRDFYGMYKCEGCGKERLLKGYDDRNFHDKVVPNMVCQGCNKSTISMGLSPDYVQTKYENWEAV